MYRAIRRNKTGERETETERERERERERGKGTDETQLWSCASHMTYQTVWRHFQLTVHHILTSVLLLAAVIRNLQNCVLWGGGVRETCDSHMTCHVHVLRVLGDMVVTKHDTRDSSTIMWLVVMETAEEKRKARSE